MFSAVLMRLSCWVGECEFASPAPGVECQGCRARRVSENAARRFLRCVARSLPSGVDRDELYRLADADVKTLWGSAFLSAEWGYSKGDESMAKIVDDAPERRVRCDQCKKMIEFSPHEVERCEIKEPWGSARGSSEGYERVKCPADGCPGHGYISQW